jgi:putative flippase GtrA
MNPPVRITTTPSVSRPTIVLLYSLFAIISIVANLGTQKIYISLSSERLAVPLSVLAGTAVGLSVKFLLDKAWIFRYQHRNVAHGLKSFFLYSMMGVATTAIFWGLELGADLICRTEAARLAGGAVGLVIGYLVKYKLDKKFVFA